MLKNGLNQNFVQNGCKDFANIGNLNEANDTLSNEIGFMFWKNLGLELSYGSILDDAQSEFWILKIILKVTLNNFVGILHGVSC